MKNKFLPPVLNALVEEYRRHLVVCSGLAGPTCRYYVVYVREFLREHHRKLGHQLDCRRLTPPDLLAYIAKKSEGTQPVTLQCIGAILRSFLRFLSLTGRCRPSLAGAVPKVGASGSRGLPCHLTPEQLEQLLESLSDDKPAAIRSLAVVSCLSKLGLRAGEVARLRLDDINWRTGTVLLPKTKCRRPRHLPLSADVGKALARYLRDGRPVSPHREVFLSLLAPPHPLSSATITELTARALRQAGIRCVRPGAHVLRHTFATHLIQRGTSLKALADLLGHRQLDTTALYAKVNLPMLREVAQPWPEVVV